MITVIAMGGNSLVDPSRPPTVANQFETTAKAVAPIAELISRGERLVLTHGNGPQIGFMQRRVEMARAELHDVPLDSLVADSQGAIGYMIERDLRDSLAARGSSAEVVTVLAEVEVDPDDPAFATPTKPIGAFHCAEEAERLRRVHGWIMVEDAGRGWRRVVPSPRPRIIVPLSVIRTLIANRVTVITCGGGGIPVARGPDGKRRGIEAVVDKDFASALLAERLSAERLVITTGVDGVYRGYRTERPERLAEVTTGALRRLALAGEFPPGSMGPKVEAAIEFLERGGREVIVCRPEDLRAAWAGRAGTHIREG